MGHRLELPVRDGRGVELALVLLSDDDRHDRFRHVQVIIGDDRAQSLPDVGVHRVVLLSALGVHAAALYGARIRQEDG